MVVIRLFDENDERRDTIAEQVIKAINFCDPKLVQIILGPRYCQLWQYWLIRAIFNYDMLSMSKTAKCELPRQIADAQLKYLEDKTSINVQELKNIQQQQKREFLKKIEDFYTRGRVLALENSGVVGSDQTVALAAENAVNKFAGNCLQDYQEFNRDCKIKDSINASVNADFTEECRLMVEETMRECEKEIEKVATVCELKNNLKQRRDELSRKETFLISRISKVKDKIIHKLQDDKFLDKDFVKVEYTKLLDYYFDSKKFALCANNPLHQYTKSGALTKKAKSYFINTSVSYGFGEYIDHAVAKYQQSDNSGKEDFLNIIRVLATNGAHSESLVKIFDTPELKELALQSIFTVSRKVYNVLFDFDDSDMSKFMSNIIGTDGKFADPLSGNVDILKSSGSPLIRTALDNLRCVEKEFQDKRKSGKANRETGLFNKIWYIVQDFAYETVLRKSYEPNTIFQHERVYKILYETLELTYLSMASGDDKVLIDYAREIEKKIDSEKNQDAKDMYAILHTIYKGYKSAKNGEEEATKWQRIWAYFSDIVNMSKNENAKNENDNIRKDKSLSTLRIAMYGAKLVNDKYDEYQKVKFTREFRNIDIRVLPGNCLINWLGATYASVDRAKIRESEKEKESTKQAEDKARQAEERANQEKAKVNRLELEKSAMKLFWRILRSLKLSEELEEAVSDKQDDIVSAVIEKVIAYNFTPEKVMMETITEMVDNLRGT